MGSKGLKQGELRKLMINFAQHSHFKLDLIKTPHFLTFFTLNVVKTGQL